MLFKIISYIKFLFSSTNQHGVHSPFVFDFVTKGLYKKRVENINFDQYMQLKSLSKKKKKILSKIVKYYKIDEINFNSIKLTKTLDKEYNLLYYNNLKCLNEINFNNLNSKNLILIEGIHQDEKSIEEWQKIIKIKEATVTIDLFQFGIIFFKKKQAKEHFKIRV